MKILYITRAFPFPLWSGYQRDYHLIHQLAQRHTIHLVALVHTPPDTQTRASIESFTQDVRCIPYPSSRPLHQSNLVRKTQRSLGYDPRLRELRTTVHALLRDHPMDAIIVSAQDTVPLVLHHPSVPVFVDLCDAYSYQMRNSIRHSPWYQFPLRLMIYLLARWGEQRMFAAAAKAYFENQRDAEALLGGHTNHAIVPTGIDLEYWQPQGTSPKEDLSILFTGNLNYPLNITAVRFILDAIYPRVLESIPQARLILAGRNPAIEILRAAERFPGVFVTGQVEDMRTYYERATVFLAPMRYTSGVHIKLLEALAMGLPVVTTPQAAEGLRTPDGTLPPLHIERTADRLASATSTVLRSPPKPSGAAREFLEQHHSWKTSAARLERLIENVANKNANS